MSEIEQDKPSPAAKALAEAIQAGLESRFSNLARASSAPTANGAGLARLANLHDYPPVAKPGRFARVIVSRLHR